jgi:hypothetical protein
MEVDSDAKSDSDAAFEFETWKNTGKDPEASETESDVDYDNDDISMIDSMLQQTGCGQTMSFLDRKKQLPGDQFEISVWKPLD